MRVRVRVMDEVRVSIIVITPGTVVAGAKLMSDIIIKCHQLTGFNVILGEKCYHDNRGRLNFRTKKKLELLFISIKIQILPKAFLSIHDFVMITLKA